MSLMTRDPEDLVLSTKPTYLFWVSPQRDVFELRYPSLEVLTGGAQPDYHDYQKAMRTFAFSLYGVRDIPRATTILLQMKEPDPASAAFDRRLATMLLFASGHDSVATRLRDSTPKMTRDVGIAALGAVMAALVNRSDLDDAAFRAFDIPVDDAEACRTLMNTLSDREQLDQAMRMARRLLSLRPNDPEGLAMVEAIQRIPRWEQVIVPVE
jgi:hypothetical protein